MVGDNAHGHLILTGRLPAGQFGNPDDQWTKYIGIVIALAPLQYAADALKPHPGIHMPGGQQV